MPALPCYTYERTVARIADRLPENAPGDFYVDRSCIDCDTCRQVAPAVFDRSDAAARSFVREQPRDAHETRRALIALVSCPTRSIGTVSKLDVSPGIDALPEALESDVYYCGFTAESSFGASSYLVVRPGGNVLVDSPRAVGPLMDRIEALGGVRWMFLTHRDDVADHKKYRARFGCERVLHARDVTSGTHDVERVIDGDAIVSLANDLRIIPVPGHTPGSAALLYADRVLFTGDHLMGYGDPVMLEASRAVCWYDWAQQRRSVERLTDFDFTAVFPGHGRRYRAASPAAMRDELRRVLATMD